jgi:hypothetical protein
VLLLLPLLPPLPLLLERVAAAILQQVLSD